MNDYKNSEKLLIVTSTFPKSKDFGDHFILNLCKVLSNNFTVIVSTPRQKDSLEYEQIGNIRIYRHDIILGKNLELGSSIKNKISKNPLLLLLTPYYILSQVIAIKGLVKKYGISKIQSNWLIPSTLSCAIYKFIFNRKIKILCTVRGSDINSLKGFVPVLVKKWVLSKVDILISVSKFLKAEVEKMGYKKEIPVYPTGIYTKFFSPSNSIPSEFTLLFVGSLIEGKGIRSLIQAIDICRKTIPSIKLHVAGDGPLLGEMKALVTALQLEKNVLFLGQVKNEDLPPLYRGSRIFVLPSAAEGFPVVISEALASGLICVTSDIPVFKDLEHAHAFIKTTKLGNTEDLAEKITEAIRDQKMLFDQKSKARKFAVANLDWSVIEKGYTKLLSDI